MLFFVNAYWSSAPRSTARGVDRCCPTTWDTRRSDISGTTFTWSMQRRRRTCGVVIAAKFEHSLKGNPLGDYMRHGTKLKIAFTTDGPAETTGALLVPGKKTFRQTRKKISRNRQWRFVHWREVLRRLAANLTEPTIDEDFPRFRRTHWERAGSAR